MGGYFDIDVDTKRERFVAALRCCLENQAKQAAADEITAGILNEVLLEQGINDLSDSCPDSCMALLAELTDMIDVVIDMFSADLKADLENSNPERPWHVLNNNQAIIATRSNDPKRMESVFEQLMFRLTEDATGIFAESMQQMDIMQTNYQLTNQHTLH